MNSTVAVVSTVSRQTLTNIFQFSVRYQAKPRIMAQTQAAIAPSVGVKMPVVMPPISSTGVMMGSTRLELEDLVEHEQRGQAGEHRELRRRAELGDQQPQQQRPADHHRQSRPAP